MVVKVPRVHGMKFMRRNGVTVGWTCPEGSDVRVVVGLGRRRAQRLPRPDHVKTASGALTADDVTDLRAKTASGDIEVGTVGGALRMQSASGDLRCVRVDGPASVTTASGDVEVGSAGDADRGQGDVG